MYIDLSAKESSKSREVSPGVVLDDDDENNLVGIEIDNASSKMDLKELILSNMTAEKQTIAALKIPLSPPLKKGEVLRFCTFQKGR